MKALWLRAVVALVYLHVVSLVILAESERCGVRKVKYNNLILGGQRATAGKWPWHATITHRTKDTVQVVCGGSIIDKYTILTAAHCLYTHHGAVARNRLLVHVGRTQLSAVDDRTRSYAPEHLIVHPGYEQQHVKDDIALIRLTQEIEMSAFIQPVCLWPAETDQRVVVGRKGYAVGFGLTDADEPSDYMLDAAVPVVDLWHCLESNRDAFATQLARTMLCAGARDGVGPCNGGSGGGLFFRVEDAWFVRGIVSFAPNLDGVAKCDPSQYTVYTDVAKYSGWISAVYENDTLNSPVRASVTLDQPRASINADGCGVEAPLYERARTLDGVFGFPWATTIEYLGVDYRRQDECHAYLITEWHLLTAASCVQDVVENYQEIFVRLGNFNISGLPKPQVRFVEKVSVHRQYNKPQHANDVALLKRRKKVNVKDGIVSPICLPTAVEPAAGSSVQLSVQGSRRFFSRSEHWSVGDASSELCEKHYREAGQTLPTDQSFICTRSAEVGKSASSLTTLPALMGQRVGSGTKTLVGFVPKLLANLESGSYLAFVNISLYEDWVTSNIH